MNQEDGGSYEFSNCLKTYKKVPEVMSLLKYKYNIEKSEQLRLFFRASLFNQPTNFVLPVPVTHLTDVTVDMETAVQSNYPDSLLLTLFGHDGLTTHRTARRVLPVKDKKHQHELARVNLERKNFKSHPRVQQVCEMCVYL